jgi:hypothetical protein
MAKRKSKSRKTVSRTPTGVSATTPAPPAETQISPEELELSDPNPDPVTPEPEDPGTGVVGDSKDPLARDVPEVPQGAGDGVLSVVKQDKEVVVDTFPDTLTVLVRKDVNRMVVGRTAYRFTEGKLYKVPFEVGQRLFKAGYA